MSQIRQRAWTNLLVWGVAGIVLTVVFFAWGGPSEFAAESGRVAATAVALGLGYVVYFAVMWRTRGRGRVASDERDELVVGRAGQAALVAVLLWVFAVGIGLWLAYDAAGAVPVGWMWFLAYATVIVGLVSHGAATLVLDARLGGHG